ncbi:intraflagellar transport protein 25 homolog [Synchiropus splendidus]|uniref:intraflagellar transport protein 25 homolog n=1 Tax=Synchiropus splendidus TaxID=270530 RepID=UPI00237ECDFE|nr:intraflagellar transport protein 25 homolog [Synchiropus splendidus]
MLDSAMASLGAKVVATTSSDENHPPENIIDGNSKTFWMSTGLFPQEIIIRLAEPTNTSKVTVDSYNVRHLKVETNASQNASNFKFAGEKEFDQTEGHLQSNTITISGTNATHLRFIITSGYDHFVSVHSVNIQI